MANGLSAAGFTLYGFGLLGKAAVEEEILWLAGFTVFTPYMTSALVIVLLSVFLANALEDTPIEEWAANGPFGKDEGDHDFAYLREDETVAYNALANALYTPSIEVKRLTAPAFAESKKGDIRVTVKLPNFTIEQDEVDLRAYACKKLVLHSTMHLNPNTMVTYRESPVQQQPFIIKQRITGGRLTAVEYYFHSDNLDTWQAKARLFLAEGPTLVPDPTYVLKGVRENRQYQPPVQQPDESNTAYLQRYEAHQAKKDAAIDPSIPGWVYSDPS